MDQAERDADIRAWLATPEGEAWSRGTHAPVDSLHGLFAAVLPVPLGKPWRPNKPQ